MVAVVAHLRLLMVPLAAVGLLPLLLLLQVLVQRLVTRLELVNIQCLGPGTPQPASGWPVLWTRNCSLRGWATTRRCPSTSASTATFETST